MCLAKKESISREMALQHGNLTARVVSRDQKQFHFIEMARGNSGHGAKIRKHVFICLSPVSLCSAFNFKNYFQMVFLVVFSMSSRYVGRRNLNWHHPFEVIFIWGLTQMLGA